MDQIERLVGYGGRFGKKDDSAFFGYCVRSNLEREEDIARQQWMECYTVWERWRLMLDC